jgi:hypothetical protein
VPDGGAGCLTRLRTLEPEPGAFPDAEPEPGAFPDAEPEPGAFPDAEPEPDAFPDAEPEPGAFPDAEPEPGAFPDAEPEPGAFPDAEPGPGEPLDRRESHRARSIRSAAGISPDSFTASDRNAAIATSHLTYRTIRLCISADGRPAFH